MRKRTSGQQNVEQVAGIIAANYPLTTQYQTDPPTVDEWAKTQNEEGWGFEVRYDFQEYPDARSYTRVRDLSLGTGDLRKAIDLACEYEPTLRAVHRRAPLSAAKG